MKKAHENARAGAVLHEGLGMVYKSLSRANGAGLVRFGDAYSAARGTHLRTGKGRGCQGRRQAVSVN